MKRLSLIAAFAIASLLLCGNVRADAPTFEEFITVGNVSDTLQKSVFGWEETPVLYYKIVPPTAGSLVSFWLDDGLNSYAIGGVPDGSGAGWLSLANWDSVKKQGDWEVKGFYQYGDHELQQLCATTNFVVTPEPASMVLFGLGGLPLAAGLLRRKKRA